MTGIETVIIDVDQLQAERDYLRRELDNALAELNDAREAVPDTIGNPSEDSVAHRIEILVSQSEERIGQLYTELYAAGANVARQTAFIEEVINALPSAYRQVNTNPASCVSALVTDYRQQIAELQREVADLRGPKNTQDAYIRAATINVPPAYRSDGEDLPESIANMAHDLAGAVKSGSEAKVCEAEVKRLTLQLHDLRDVEAVRDALLAERRHLLAAIKALTEALTGAEAIERQHLINKMFVELEARGLRALNDRQDSA